MTNKEAFAEAQRRWGKHARVDMFTQLWDLEGTSIKCEHLLPSGAIWTMYCVYEWLGAPGAIDGKGVSWKAAFADADSKSTKGPKE
jgi:hypothetical protein